MYLVSCVHKEKLADGSRIRLQGIILNTKKKPKQLQKMSVFERFSFSGITLTPISFFKNEMDSI